MQMKNFQTISNIISLQFSVFPENFDYSQVKIYLVFSIKNYVYDFPHELPNKLILMTLRN